MKTGAVIVAAVMSSRMGDFKPLIRMERYERYSAEVRRFAEEYFDKHIKEYWS